MDKVGEYTLEVMKKAKWYNLWHMTFFDKHLKGDILEVGTGIGNFTMLLAKYGSVTGIEKNRRYIGIFKDDAIKYGYGDIEKGKYFFKKRKFDTIVCLNVLEHIKDDKRALGNMYSLLNKNGKLILLVPAHDLLCSKYDKLLGHFRRYNIPKTESKIRNAGFSIVNSRYINWWGALGWLFYLKLLNKEEFPEKEVGIFDILGKIFLWPEKFIKPPFGLSVLAVARRNKRY